MPLNYKYKKNSDDIFMRSVYAGLTETLTNVTKYVQIEDDNTKKMIRVPFYLSATGQERFLYYYFSGKNYETCEEFVEGSYDVVPRGVITFDGFTIASSEITSPHARAEFFEVDNDGKVLTYSAIISSIPLKMSFTLEILSSTENERMKISQSLIEELYFVRKFHFYYQGIVVPAQISFPDSGGYEGKNLVYSYGDIENPRQKLTIECETYLPRKNEDSKMFKGHRISKFIHSYDTNNSDIETINTEMYGRLSGRILNETDLEPFTKNLQLINAENEVHSVSNIQDGYYFFNKISPNTGYRIEDTDSNVLKRDIVIYPKDNKELDFEV